MSPIPPPKPKATPEQFRKALHNVTLFISTAETILKNKPQEERAKLFPQKPYAVQTLQLVSRAEELRRRGRLNKYVQATLLKNLAADTGFAYFESVGVFVHISQMEKLFRTLNILRDEKQEPQAKKEMELASSKA